MHYLQVFLLLVAAVSVSGLIEAQFCGLKQRLSMKKQWALVYEMGDPEPRHQLALRVWKRILAKHPEIINKHLVKVNAMDLDSHEFLDFAAKTLGGFDLCVSVFETDSVLQIQFEHLQTYHKPHMELNPQYFNSFITGLIEIAESLIGEDDFDRDAWELCGRYVMAGIQSLPLKEETYTIDREEL